VLEARQCIGEAEGHYLKLEGAKWGHEHGFPFISGSDVDLIVSGFEVKLGEEF
jgi:hypothetical protein